MKFCYTKNLRRMYERLMIEMLVQVYEEEIISMERVYESLKRFRHKIKTVEDEPHSDPTSEESMT